MQRRLRRLLFTEAFETVVFTRFTPRGASPVDSVPALSIIDEALLEMKGTAGLGWGA